MIKRDIVDNYIKGFKNKKVLIVGDVMVDAYMWGNVNRISPEAPIPVVSIKERDYRLGGAANVALNVSALGAEVILCSVIGKDEQGKIFKELLSKRELTNKGIVESDIRKTTVKTRIISNGQHLLRVDEEEVGNINNNCENELFNKISNILIDSNIDVIIFEDYDKGVLSKNLISKICSLAKQKDIYTTVDPKKDNFNFYNGVSLFKPNLKEFSEGVKEYIAKDDIKMLKKYAKEFIKQQNIDNLLITLSENGVFIANDTEMLHFGAEVRDISDVSGAGDTVISVASLLLASGASIDEIAQISNIAGGLVCEKTGVVPININELAEEF